MQNHLHLYGMSVTYTRWVHHGEAVDHHLDLADAQVEEEEEEVVAEPVSLTNIETILRIPRTFTCRRKTVGPHVGTMQRGCHPRK